MVVVRGQEIRSAWLHWHVIIAGKLQAGRNSDLLNCVQAAERDNGMVWYSLLYVYVWYCWLRSLIVWYV